MLIIEVKEKENIDRALKRYKRKYRDARIREELMRRRQFVKPSTARRKEILKAIYKNQMGEES